MSATDFKTLSFLERKEYEELKRLHSDESKKKKERAVFLGFFVIALIATLIISGAMNFM